jgi:IclR helix-turn-helix domain
MIAGGRIAQIVAVTAELGIPDLLKDGARTDLDLAEATGTHGPSLHRLLQALAALGLVSIEEGGYILTPLGAALQSDTRERLDLFARYVGHEASGRAWGHLPHSIRTGNAAFSDLFGMHPWEYGEQHPLRTRCA